MSKATKTAVAQTFAILLMLGIAGCATTPSQTNSTLSTDDAQPACEKDCEEDDVNRYQYYLGILSVWLIG